MALGGAAGGIGVGRKPTRSGRIIFDGMWSYYNKLKVVDYDYYVRIEGFDKEGNPLTIASPLGYQNWRSMNKYNRNGWSFKKSPDIAFKDAWKNYQVAGGDTFLNWTQVYTDYFWTQSENEADRANMLGWVEYFFPQMRQTIIDSIPEGVRDNVEIILEGGVPKR